MGLWHQGPVAMRAPPSNRPAQPDRSARQQSGESIQSSNLTKYRALAAHWPLMEINAPLA